MAAPESQIKIFISYRRYGEVGFVGRLSDRLSLAYGEKNVFRDVSGLRSGDDFEKRIGSKLSEATIVIAVIGPNWVGRRAFQKSKIGTDYDWVRKELEHALASQIPIIPVLVFDTLLPAPSQLPSSLKGLLSVQTARIRDESWENDCSELIKAIDTVVQDPRSQDVELPFVWRRFESDKPSRLRRALLIVTLVALIAAASIYVMWNQKANTVRLDNPSTWTSPPSSAARSPIGHLALQLALFELHAGTDSIPEAVALIAEEVHSLSKDSVYDWIKADKIPVHREFGQMWLDEDGFHLAKHLAVDRFLRWQSKKLLVEGGKNPEAAKKYISRARHAGKSLRDIAKLIIGSVRP